MPKVIEVNTKQTVSYLYQQGWSICRISRELKLHRATVSKYVKCTSDSNTGEAKKNGPSSACEKYSDFIKSKYKQGLSADRIWRDLQSEYLS